MQRPKFKHAREENGWIESPSADERESLIHSSSPVKSPPQRRQSASEAPAFSLSSCWSHRQIDYCDISPAADRATRELSGVLLEPLGSPDDARTAGSLARIWKAAGLGGGASQPPIPDELWKTLGFQGKNPLTDVRGARLSGLVFMARLLEERGAESRPLLGNAGEGFPFAIACLNALFLLEVHLRLGGSAGGAHPPSYCPCCGVAVRAEYGPAQPHRGRHIRGFAALVVADPDALFDVFSACVLLCGRLWAAAASRGGGSDRISVNPLSVAAARDGAVADPDLRLLQFPSMLRAVKDAVLRCLASSPPTVGAATAAIAASFREAHHQQQLLHWRPHGK